MHLTKSYMWADSHINSTLFILVIPLMSRVVDCHLSGVNPAFLLKTAPAFAPAYVPSKEN